MTEEKPAATAQAASLREQAFDMSGIERGEDGVARYLDRPRSLLEMLRRTVERKPDAEAIVELGGERLSYTELWERSAKVAGGLLAEGIGRGARLALQLRARAAAAGGRSHLGGGSRPRRPGGDLLHERHHRLPEGGDDQPLELPVKHRDRPPGRGAPARRRLPRTDLGAAVPRDGLQQPTASGLRARRLHGDHAAVRGAGLPARDRGRADRP